MPLIWRWGQVSCFRPYEAGSAGHLLARAGKCFSDLCAAFVDLRGEEEGIPLAGRFLGR